MSFNPFTLFGLLGKPAPEPTKEVRLQRDVVDRRNNSYNRGAGFNSFESFPSIANQRRTPTGRQFSELDRMRARLRWLYNNDPYIASVVENLMLNVLGSTLPKLFIDSPRLNEKARKIVGDQYRAWARNAERVDFLGRHDLYMMLSIIIRHFILEGEAFIRIHRGNDFKLEIIDPGLVPVYTTEGSIRSSGNVYQLGAVVDPAGRVTHWAVNSPVDNVGYRQIYTQFLSEHTNIVPAKDMLHFYDPAESNSYRGEPCLGSVLTTASTLMEYNDAALVNAKFGASNIGFIKQAYMEELNGGGAAISDAIAKSGTTDNPEGTSVLDATANASIVTDSGVSINQVQAGYEFQPYQTNYPESQFAPFTQAHQRNISAAAGVAHHSASGDLSGVNFSSGRIGEKQMERRAERLQTLLDTQVISKIIPLLMGQLLMDGRIQPRTYKQCAEDETFRIVYTRGFSIDPLKKVQAESTELMNGTRSRREIIAADGRDPDAVLKQIKEEQEAQPSSSGGGEEPKPKPKPEPKDEDDSTEDEGDDKTDDDNTDE